MTTPLKYFIVLYNTHIITIILLLLLPVFSVTQWYHVRLKKFSLWQEKKISRLVIITITAYRLIIKQN